MGNDDDSIKIYGNKDSNEKEESKRLSTLRRINSILSVIFILIWIIVIIASIKRGYKNYYIYSTIFILIPFLFTILSNFYISKKLKDITREVIRCIGKSLLIIFLFIQLIRPSILNDIGFKFLLQSSSESVGVSNEQKAQSKLLKNYNILVARVNEHDYSEYWRNSVVEETYDNNKIISSVEIISFNKDTLEITTTIIPTGTQVKYFSKDYVDELAYSFRAGGEENLKAIVESNFNIKLDDLILLDNTKVKKLIDVYIADTEINFTESGVKVDINDKEVNINSLYKPSEDDINNMYSLSKELLYKIYSKDQSEFEAIKDQLLKITNKNELAFLNDSYLVYNRLINEQKEIKNIQNIINTKSIKFTSILEAQNIKDSSIPYLNSYELVVYSEEILKDNIIVKNIIEKQLNEKNNNDAVTNISNDVNIDYQNNNSESNTNTTGNTNNSSNNSNTGSAGNENGDVTTPTDKPEEEPTTPTDKPNEEEEPTTPTDKPNEEEEPTTPTDKPEEEEPTTPTDKPEEEEPTTPTNKPDEVEEPTTSLDKPSDEE